MNIAIRFSLVVLRNESIIEDNASNKINSKYLMCSMAKISMNPMVFYSAFLSTF